MINRYIKDGMIRFITRQYYPESNVTLAGMIAFVEVDTVKHKNGFMPINEIAEQLKSTIDTYKNILNLAQELLPYPLGDQKFVGISDFHNSYWTKHIRNDDCVEINVHHLLLDYYDILIP
jgi:hypothetical protein